MSKSSTYCVMPHIGMALQNHSDFCCCNLNKASWQDNRRKPMFVTTAELDSVYQSHTRKMIAAALDNGIKHPSCQVCWDIESTNSQKSARQQFNELFENVAPLPDQPRVLIIKPGNTCNFACRMCGPVTSSTWYADGYELEKSNLASNSWHVGEESSDKVANITFNEYTKTFEYIRNSFNQDNEKFWNTLKSWIKNLVLIDIYGGEPFLIPAMFDLLQHGIDIGANKNIELYLSTNSSIFNERYLNILTQYKKVNFRVSIDAVDPAQLEYIRHKADYKNVVENTKKFQQILTAHPTIEMWITNTITPINVNEVDRTTAQLENMFELPVSLNLVTTPEYDIRHLPVPVKNYLIDNLKQNKITNFLKQTIPGCDIEWPKFCRVTDKLDQLRNQSFAKTFPDWWKMLEPYWVK